MTSFVINHKRYDAGTVFQVTTPELGTLLAPVANARQMATVGAMGLKLGPIATPLPCRSPQHPEHNAWLHVYALGDYLRLQVIYTCTCPYEYHNHSLEWDVLFNETTIVATEVGSYFRQPHNHPMAVGFEELAPAPFLPEPLQNPAKEMQRECKASGEPASAPVPFRNLPRVETPVPVAPSLADPVAAPSKPVVEAPDPRVSRNGQFTLF